MTKRKTPPVFALLAPLLCIALHCARTKIPRPLQSTACPNRDAFIPFTGIVAGSAQHRRNQPFVHVQLSPRLEPVSPVVAIAGERITTSGEQIARITNLRPGPPYTIVLYADLDEYAACTSGISAQALQDTTGHYDSRVREFHVPATAREPDWRHEWVHAVLADHTPAAPYWLHEGLAILLEETEQLDRAPRLPARILALRDRVKHHVADGGLLALLERRSPGRWAAPTAAYFCAYLSAQGRLTAAIANGGVIDADRTAARWQADFLGWLTDPAAVSSAP